MTVEIIVNGSCTACGRCRKICPKGPKVWDRRIDEKEKMVYFAKKPGSCLFCKNCVGVCPVEALSVINI
ncbi:MAG: 4Fe-4S dicluster domain-containing protein [Candidatus Methanomarinus sp.]|uniref:4Fe-4S dicluster domain-containing protein n=1 Tax=Candidatus Methanomarinus sp. TaxID=3386244 RepID=A0AC61SDV3_9EURY|nr:MAG: 4Fe-4S dicluster domain-containing protein [ANME-2 cluster archaeon]